MNTKVIPSKESIAYIIEMMIISLISGCFITNIFNSTYKYTEDIDYLADENITKFFGIMCFYTAIVMVLYYLKKETASIVMFATSCMYCMKIVTNYEKDIYVCMGAIVITLLTFVYVRKDVIKVLDKAAKWKYTGLIIAIGAGIFVTIFIGTVGVLRYKSFTSHGFDFGIFAQMYENMRTTGLPVTTVERQQMGEFSHFGVHFSPALYLTLPLYMLFPSPETVQIMQALVLGIAVIPLYMLCRHYKFSSTFSGLICAIYCLFPAIAAGTFYDFHENCFIPVFLFSLILSFEKKNNLCIGIFALLLAMVKEDAAFYVLICGAYFIVSKRDVLRGTVSCVGAIVYFSVAMAIVHSYGLGDLSNSRFSNVLYDSEAGLVQIIVTIILNPAYIVSQIFTQEKLVYMLLMLLPVSYALFQKKTYSRYVLLGTFVVFNLIPSYKYLHDINFQYHFGAVVLILYITIMSVAEWNDSKRKCWGVVSLVICMILFNGFCFTKYTDYKEKYDEKKDLYVMMEENLDIIPEDSRVIASSTIVAHLAHIRDLMIIKEKVILNHDYIVIDNRYSKNDTEKLEPEFENNYEIIKEDDTLLIYKRIGSQ